MMNATKFSVLLSAVACVVGAASASIAGCGGDNSVGETTDGGESDVTLDVGNDVGADVVGPTGDAGDAMTTTDTGAGDAGPDVVITPVPLANYQVAQATALCTRQSECCNLDGGSFNLAQCVIDNTGYGFNNTLPEAPSILDAGHLVYDMDAGSACVHGVSQLACQGITGAQFGALTRLCFRALQGNVPVGSACSSSFECVSGSYCGATVDAGSQCLKLIDAGALCDTNVGDQSCSYLGSGNPPYYCNTISPGDAGSKCEPVRADGVTCTSGPPYSDSFACQSLSCGDDYTCGSTTTLVSGSFCAYYTVKADAGDGGDGG
jgi:hypothetical protein